MRTCCISISRSDFKNREIAKRTCGWRSNVSDKDEDKDEDEDENEDEYEDEYEDEDEDEDDSISRSIQSEEDPYYADPQNITSWTEQNLLDPSSPTETKREEDASETAIYPTDRREEDLSIGHRALRDSEAYRWLISSVNRNQILDKMQAKEMERHRSWLFTLLDSSLSPEQINTIQRVSRHRKPVIYTLEFQLDWNIMTFLKYHQFANSNLDLFVGRAITLTGDENEVQALPCKEYMEQVWHMGLEFVRILESLVRSPDQAHRSKSPLLHLCNMLSLHTRQNLSPLN